MGCSGPSKISRHEVNGSVYRKVTKEEIQVKQGNKISVLNHGPIIIFVYGGPGSKKGRLVSELVEVFDFTFINIEKIMIDNASEEQIDIEVEESSGDTGRTRKESVEQLKKMCEDDPSSVSLSSILNEVAAQVDKNPQGRYLVDMMPNLKYLMRTATFSSDCTSHMQQFEKKFPISFALYFSLNMGNKNKENETKIEEEVKEETEEEKAGFQSDEADVSRTKRRQSMFENSVMYLLEYFNKSDRLIEVDVSSKNVDAIASRSCELLSRLSLQNLKLVNTVLIFIFDFQSIDTDLLSVNDIELIQLETPGAKLSLCTLEDAIRQFVNQLNHKEHKTFVVDMSSSNIHKMTNVEVSKSAIVFISETNIERYFDMPGFQGMYKAVSSLENAVCIFPADTNQNLCKKIAVAFNNQFSNPREKTGIDVM